MLPELDPLPEPIEKDAPNVSAAFKLVAESAWPGAVEVERTDKAIVFQNPLDPSQFMLQASAAPIHYGDNLDEIDTEWAESSGKWTHESTKNLAQAFVNSETGAFAYTDPVSGETLEMTLDSFFWVNEVEETQPLAKLPLLPGITKQFLKWEGVWGPGIDLTLEVQPGRLAKNLTIDSFSSLATPQLAGEIHLSHKLKLTLSTKMGIFVDGKPWDQGEAVITANAIEFRNLETDALFFGFLVPYAKDANAEEIGGLLRLSASAGELFVEALVPYAWLQTAAYPVLFDPTIDAQVAAGADDASESSTGANFTSIQTSVRCDSNTAGASRFFGGMRFTVNLPAGATIDVNSYFTIVASSTSVDDPNVDMSFENATNPVDFSTNADVTSRARVASSVQWTATAIGVGSVNSPGIAAPLQLVANLGAQTTIVGFMDGRADSNFNFRPTSYDGSTTNAPKIHIEYTVAGGGTILPFMMHLT